MARLRDVPRAVRLIGIGTLCKRVYQQIGEDSIFTWAAALAYSWVFALFPFLIFLLTLVPHLPEQYRAGAERRISETVSEYLPNEAAMTIVREISRLLNEPRGGLLSIGLLVTIWAASGGMAMTMAALDQCYDIERTKPYLKQRLQAVGLTLVIASLILLAIALGPVTSGLLAWMRKYGNVLGPLLYPLNFARYALALMLLFAVLAVLYHFGPNIRRRFLWITPGAMFAVMVWIILAVAFRFYINRFGAEGYSKTYGAVGGVAVLLFFFYIDALVLMIGAEINSEVDFAVLNGPAESLSEEEKALAQELSQKREPWPTQVKPSAR